MHPFLLHRRWLLAYLAVWAPLSLVPATVLGAGGAVGVGMGLALALCPTLLFALLTLPAWYLCRAARPGWSTLPRVLVTHGAAALAAVVLWLALLQVVAGLAALVPGAPALPARLRAQLPAMAAVGALFYALVAAFHYLLASLRAAHDADERAATLAVKAREAELAALRARVQPHFLFNSLNTIHALITADPASARRTCVALADFLRDSLRTANGRPIPLADELALVRAYLAVEQVRLGPRLVVHEDVEPGGLACRLPPLLLQPLVENAVRHGISRLEAGGTLRLVARRSGDLLTLQVANPYDPKAPPRPGHGQGLASVRERLAAAFGDEARVDVRRDGDVFDVTLHLPADDGGAP